MKTVKIRKCKCIPPPWYAATVEIPTKHSIWIGRIRESVDLWLKRIPIVEPIKPARCIPQPGTQQNIRESFMQSKCEESSIYRTALLYPYPSVGALLWSWSIWGLGGFWGEVPPCMPICYKYKSIFNAYTLIMAYMSRQCKVIDQIWSIKL